MDGKKITITVSSDEADSETIVSDPVEEDETYITDREEAVAYAETLAREYRAQGYEVEVRLDAWAEAWMEHVKRNAH